MSAARWIASAVEPVVNAAIGLDEDAQQRVAALGAAVLEVQVTGLGVSLFVAGAGDRLRITGESEAPAAARISGPPASLARLATVGGTRVLFSGSVHVEGDVVVAKGYKRLFDTLEPDWEEALARLTGDIPAHETGRAVRALTDGLQRAVEGRRQDLRAWLIDEIEALPAPAEVDEWLGAVDRLRADGDRLAARVARLERRRQGGDP
ncbi:MAG: SCP2 sterol-binding domain-containing protein [Halofilum sp. (in: g-proteobacteria)]|nr:SCP2 sterol-binding domain-containing protein [Halofilum sp. (in: g-proteobacteria)]